MGLIEDLLAREPVWQLTCDISETAAQCQETALFPADILGRWDLL